ncbi:MAG: DMT family transporter [Rhodospirillales bacterium]|nr:DMT family transporter [Rhodospirillales bacterium]
MISRLSRACGKIPASVRGAIWMILAAGLFASLTALVRHVSASVPPVEIVFFRSAFSLLFMLPWALSTGVANLRTRRLGLHGLRALTALGSFICWYLAFAVMPIAEATALTFTAPLFATIGAVFFLGEVVEPRRVSAIIIGFVGAMVILRPGIEVITLPALLVLAGAAFYAISVLAIKSLSRTESAGTIVIYLGILMTPMSLIPALFFWTLPSLETLAWLAGIGLVATFSQLTLSRALRVADATAVLPFEYSKLIFAAILGYAVFGEQPDLWTWTGATIIFLATLYTARREALSGTRQS